MTQAFPNVFSDHQKDLERVWLLMALGMTSHRYFLHVDPMLNAITGLNNLERCAPFLKLEERQLGQHGRFGELLANVFGAYVEGRVRLVTRGDTDLQCVEMCTDIRTLEPQFVENGLDCLNLRLGLLRISGSPARNVVALGARIFVPQSIPYSKALGVILGVVSFDPEATEACAKHVAFGAGRNLFLLFLLAREEASQLPLPALERRLQEIEDQYSSLVNTVAEAVARLSTSEADDDVFPIDRPQEFFDAVSSIDFMPAQDLALSICDTPWRFNKFNEGLGIGQS